MPFDLTFPRLNTLVTAAAAIGLLPMPELYLFALRVLVCGVALFYLTRPAGVRDADKWALVLLVLYFNPVVPVSLGGRPAWWLMTAVMVIYFWVLGWRTAAAHRLRWRR